MKYTHEESENVPYAIFQTGGKQYQAVAGKTIAVEKLNAEPNQSIDFSEVLLRKTFDTNGKEVVAIGQPFLDTPVKASVVKQMRGPKVIIFRFQRRKKYKRKAGHRQSHTVLRIDSIGA